MITLPPEFIATRIPGYFWNTRTQSLFTLKGGGVLRELVITKPNPFNHIREPGYRVSHLGQRRWLMISYLQSLRQFDTTIPVIRMTLKQVVRDIRQATTVTELCEIVDRANKYWRCGEMVIRDIEWVYLTDVVAEQLTKIERKEHNNGNV